MLVSPAVPVRSGPVRGGRARGGPVRRGPARGGRVRSLVVRLALLLAAVAVCSPAGGTAALATDRPWRWPLSGPHAVARPFEAPAHRYAPGHRGADLPGLPGEPVRSAGAGRVSYAGLLAGRGVVVVVHGPLRTTYEPVTATVDVGSVVSAGDVLGVLDAGHLGCWAPACLHWGLKRGEDYLDPVRLVERGPVRLLPVEDQAVSRLTSTLGAGQAARPRLAVRAAPAVSLGGPQELVPAGAAAPPASRVLAQQDRVLAPGAQPARPADRSRRTAAGLVSAASLLGAVAVGAALRRRG